MIAKIIAAVKALFVKDKISLLFKILLQNAARKIVSEITDRENQRKAYEFVKNLHNRKDMTSREKAETFNLKMLAWCRDAGRELSSSAINTLRELALTAFKSELERIEAEKLEAAKKSESKPGK